MPATVPPTDSESMRIRVTWPNGREREVEVYTLRELDRFVEWHQRESKRVDLKPDGDGLQLLVLD